MTNFLISILGDKKNGRQWRRFARALPREYRIVHGEMKSYLWKFSSGDGMATVAILEGVLGVFENGAADELAR